MVTINLQGGLGNQLFQIATTYALSRRNNDECCFDIDGHRIGLQGRDALNYKNTIYRKLKNQKIDCDEMFNENGFHYQEIPYKPNLKLNGYFQSEKYFADYRDEILDLFEPTEDILEYINKKYGHLLNNENTCSIHIRHGDYLRFPDHHPILPPTYYNESFKNFGNDYTYLVFSDNISWCEKVFNHINFNLISGEQDYIDLYVMSLCKNNIMANSSFSWWGSYLNKNENKKIIAPSPWFGPAYSNWNTDDLYYDKMIKICY